MKIPGSTYHYHASKKDRADPDLELKEHIIKIFYDNNQNYGYRRITSELKGKANHKKVLRIMNDLNLKCIKFHHKSRKYKSYKGTVGKIAPNRITRKFKAAYPLQKLTTDVTEFKCLGSAKLYLSPIMDMYNSEIISYKISNHPTLDIALEPLQETIERVNKEAIYRTTIHSDQGWQYQHKAWVQLLKDNKIFQSMSRKGNCLDNSIMENFFGILKQEMYYGEKLVSYQELKRRIEDYINYYNCFRIKEKLVGMSPIQYRQHNHQLTN